VPFYRAGQFWGVATIDMALERLTQETARFKLGTGGYAFIVSQQGHFIAHPDAAKIMHGTIQEENPELAALMMAGGSGFVPTTDPRNKQAAWIAYEPVKSSGFSLGLVYPTAAVMGEAFALRRELIALGAVAVIALFVALIVISRSISRPVAALAAAAREVAAGNFDQKIDATGATDEVRNLARAFTRMTRDLQMRMQELRYTTTLKERLEGELAGARAIQMALLSQDFPATPEFEIHAVVRPAREIGGDFYDFYRLDEDRYVFLIADVSGKGIPAALFMAVTKTLLKASSSGELSPGEIVARVNNGLCAETDTGMFVTLLYALLNTATGEIEFCNAGHLPPFLVRENGDVSPLDAPNCAALGLLRDLEYGTARTHLAPGDTLFLFTDGVTEALDGRREFYSPQRLQIVLRDVHGLPVSRITRGVVQDVRSFSGEHGQSDDISVLALRWHGSSAASRTGASSPLTATLS
jgi:sigma-B regulation protein RsbU (phosphoserine phosphatase)